MSNDPLSDPLSTTPGTSSVPVLPAYGRGCVTELMPAVADGVDASLPISIGDGPRVLLVLDGLGWDQLQTWKHLLPTLSSFSGDRITTVAPSTTAAALTSITTSLSPAQHGIVGYRMMVDGSAFNCLRWGTDDRPDCRKTIPPTLIQPYEPFLGRSLAFVTKAEFRRTGFTDAHLRGGRLSGYRTPAILVHELARLIGEGEQVVYGYYDGIDKVAHEFGLGSEYEAELAFADRLVADVLNRLPAGAQLVVTADHGQVDCGDRLLSLHPDVVSQCAGLSGEARFRWLHCTEGNGGGGNDADAMSLASLAEQHHGHQAWVRTRAQILDEQWFGPGMTDNVADRLGDVALLPFDPIGFDDPSDSGPFSLIGRHGSLTAAEMYVPCLSVIAS